MTVSTAVATIHTNHGDIKVDLFGHHAPQTVANFIGLATGGLGLGFAAAASAARIVQRDTTEGRVYW